MKTWWIPLLAVGGLPLAIMAAGLVGLLLNLTVQRAAEAASYDVELEDHGDDLRVAVLDLRQYHRNLLFYEPTPDRVAERHTTLCDRRSTSSRSSVSETSKLRGRPRSAAPPPSTTTASGRL